MVSEFTAHNTCDECYVAIRSSLDKPFPQLLAENLSGFFSFSNSAPGNRRPAGRPPDAHAARRRLPRDGRRSSLLASRRRRRQPRRRTPVAPGCVGRVIDVKTRAGIGAVRVRLDDGAAETTTGPDGGFEFRDVPSGTSPRRRRARGLRPVRSRHRRRRTRGRRPRRHRIQPGHDDGGARHRRRLRRRPPPVPALGTAETDRTPGGVGRRRPRRHAARDAAAPGRDRRRRTIATT